jgi:hypothetical protein
MKHYIKYRLAVLLIPVLFFSCYKQTNDNLDQVEKFYMDNTEAIAQVKFIHAYTPLTINTLTTSTVGFRITQDGNKINAATNTSSSTNTLMYGGVYPPTTAYAFLPPGQRNIRFTMNRITAGAYAPITGDEVFNSTVALTAGKKYSMFIADPYTAPATYMIEDNWIEPLQNRFGLRFINLSGDAASRYDIYSSRHGLIFPNVGYKEMRDYKYLTVPSVTDTFTMRLAGTSTFVASINGFTPTSQRVYTIYARGKTGVTGRLPSITTYTNR